MEGPDRQGAATFGTDLAAAQHLHGRVLLRCLAEVHGDGAQPQRPVRREVSGVGETDAEDTALPPRDRGGAHRAAVLLVEDVGVRPPPTAHQEGGDDAGREQPAAAE